MIKTYVANDAGTDSVKAELDGQLFEMPSVIAIQGSQDITEPVRFDNKEAEKTYMMDFMNHMDVSISSSSIKEQRRLLVGRAAVDSQLQLTGFDMSDLSGKSETDLTLVLTLSMIAGYSVKRAYKAGESLSEPLKVETVMTTALPISEGKQPGVIESYKNKYLNHTHVVTFHNFKDPITVSITFSRVEVGLEGEMAQVAIRNGKLVDKLENVIFDELQHKYPDIADKAKFSDIANAHCSLGIDVGGKTVDLALVNDGRVNSKTSVSLMRGFDNVLQSVIDELQTSIQHRYSFNSIAQLQNFLAHPNPFANNARKDVVNTIKMFTEPFADQIVQATSKVLRQSGSSVMIIFLYGGGSITMTSYSQLVAKLTEKTASFNGGQAIPVLVIPPKFAQRMNLFGLQLYLQALKDNG